MLPTPVNRIKVSNLLSSHHTVNSSSSLVEEEISIVITTSTGPDLRPVTTSRMPTDMTIEGHLSGMTVTSAINGICVINVTEATTGEMIETTDAQEKEAARIPVASQAKNLTKVVGTTKEIDVGTTMVAVEAIEITADVIEIATEQNHVTK